MKKQIRKKMLTFLMFFLLVFIIPNISISAGIQVLNQTVAHKKLNTIENYDLIIITPDDLKEGFNLLKTHKDSK